MARHGRSIPSWKDAELLLLLHLCGCVRVRADYSGVGWENIAAQRVDYKAVKVRANDPSIKIDELDDSFDWLDYEAQKKTSRLNGEENLRIPALATHTATADAVQHGFYTMYVMDGNVSQLPRRMEDLFFSVTLDAGVHPDYAAAGVRPNCTLRFSLFEGMPADLTAPATVLQLAGAGEAYVVDLSTDATSGHLGSLPSLHSRTFGLATNSSSGALVAPCAAPIHQLVLSVQCLSGHAFPAGSCTDDVTVPPRMDDCRRYCPFTLTVRALPRTLRPGDAAHSLIAPGQWQVFEFEAGPYDLLEVTIKRDEFQSEGGQTKLPLWRDGLIGEAWLTHGPGSCIQADIERETTSGCAPGWPHRLCSDSANYSYSVRVDDPWQRYVAIALGSGQQDDLGYNATLEAILEAESELEAEMHYPTQLRIRELLGRLRATRMATAFVNSSWRRSWTMRLCTGPLQAGRYFVSLYGSHDMPTDEHTGHFTLRLVQETFSAEPLAHGERRRGCLRRPSGGELGAGERTFTLATPSASPTLTTLGEASVSPYFVDDQRNRVTALAVRRGAPPSDDTFDARVSTPPVRLARDSPGARCSDARVHVMAMPAATGQRPPRGLHLPPPTPPQMLVSLSACDVLAPSVWFISVTLAPAAPLTETFFELHAALEASTSTLGALISGRGCCGGYKYYAFPGIDESVAPAVLLNLTKGAAKAVYWKWGSCPREDADVVGAQCQSWCVIRFLRTLSTSLDPPTFTYDLAIPLGEGDAPDKRRAGVWYLGIHALDEPLEYTLTTRTLKPRVQEVQQTGCTRYSHYCPQKFEEYYVATGGASSPLGGRSRALALATATATALCTYVQWRSCRGSPDR